MQSDERSEGAQRAAGGLDALPTTAPSAPVPAAFAAVHLPPGAMPVAGAAGLVLRPAEGRVAPQGLSIHSTPFSAMAALLDTCVKRVQHAASPTCASWDVRVGGRGQAGPPSPQLVFEHDCNGMGPEELRGDVGLGSVPAGAGGVQLSAFMHAVLRLGSSATVLTKRLEAGKVLPSVGVGIVVFDPGPPARAHATVLYCTPDQNLQDAARTAVPAQYHPAFARAGHSSWDELQQEVDTMQPQGTKVLIRGLWWRADGGGELDFVTDPADIRCHKADVLGDLLPAERKDAGVQRCTVHRYSLRGYFAILYRRWPEGLMLTVRGLPVQPQDIRAWMRGTVSEEYRPRGVKDEVDEHGFQMQHVVNVHVGFLLEVPNTTMQGFCVYHKNRLIKPFWRVYSSSTVGRGVVGWLEADFVPPTPDQQDFERSHAFAKLEAFLKRCVPAYWKKHAAMGGFLGAAPPQARLPPQMALPAHPHTLARVAAPGGALPAHHLMAMQPAGMPGLGRQGPGGGLGGMAPHPAIDFSAALAALGNPQMDFSWGEDAAPGPGGGSAGLALPGQPGAGHGAMLFPPSSAHMGGRAAGGRPGELQGRPGPFPFPSDLLGPGGPAGMGSGSGGSGRMKPSGPPAGLPPAMDAMLRSFSAGGSGLLGTVPSPRDGPPGGSVGGGGSGGAQEEAGTQPIQQLQQLLATAPPHIISGVSGSSAPPAGTDSSSPFFPLAQQPQQQQGGGSSAGWDALMQPPPQGALRPTLRSSSLEALHLLAGQQEGAASLGPNWELDLPLMVEQQGQGPQQQQQQQQPAADLAQALCMLVSQPRQLSQMVALLGQQAQQAEQGRHPNAAQLRRVYSLLSKLMQGQHVSSDSPHSQGGSALPQAASSEPIRPLARAGSIPSAPPAKPPLAGAPASTAPSPSQEQQAQHTQQLGLSASMAATASAAAGPEGGRQPATRGDISPLSQLLAAADADPMRCDAAPAPAGLAPAPLPPAAELAGALEAEVAAFVREAVPDSRLQQAGLELARRIRAGVEQLGESGGAAVNVPAGAGASSPMEPSAKRPRAA